MLNKCLPRLPHGLSEWGCLLLLLIVLAVMFFPLFDRRGEPRRPSCLSNEKQLTLGLLMYATDYDERLPRRLTWAQDIDAYVKNSALLVCPADKRENVVSYGVPGCWGGQRLLAPQRLASAIILYEVGPKGPEYRHESGMNIGYMDGHAKWCKEDSLPPGMILLGVDQRAAGVVKRNHH
ncbi:MAG: hypothetical protein WCP21_20460 [Armatimonadota bacterium]